VLKFFLISSLQNECVESEMPPLYGYEAENTRNLTLLLIMTFYCKAMY